MLTTGSAEAPQRRIVAGQVLSQPMADLSPELLDPDHPSRLTYQALALSALCQVGARQWQPAARTTPTASPPAVLSRMAFDHADDAAVVTDERRLTFAELHQEVRHTAAAIAGLGVRPATGSPSGPPNTWHWVVACLAIHYAGAVVVPINTRYTAEEAADTLARTHAPVLIAMGRFLGADRVADLDRASLPALRHVVRVPIEEPEGSWDDFWPVRRFHSPRSTPGGGGGAAR